jgi:hypothetical protein
LLAPNTLIFNLSNDANSVAFKQQFKKPALALGSHSSFTPHYMVLDGKYFHCNEMVGNVVFKCGKQCTNGGRYCAEDPGRYAGV